VSAHPADPDPDPDLDPGPGTTRTEVWLSAADPARDAALRGAIEGRALVTSVSLEELRRRLATPARPAAIVVDGDEVDATDLVEAVGGAAVLVIGAADAPAGLVEPWTDVAPAAVPVEEVALRLARVLKGRQQRLELARTTDTLAHTSHQLERFVYTASHDLKEPLRAITGFSRLLVTRHADQLEDQARTYLDFVTDGAERLGRMINALQTFSVLSRHEVSTAEVSLSSVVEELLVDLDTDGVELTIGDLPTVRSDRTLVTEVVRVLLDNALRYRADGTDDGSPHEVTVEARSGSESWTLDVVDSGIGVAPNDHERIFDMFARLHTREAYAGQGIGLAVARMAAGRLGGRIELDSRLGEGATFRVTVPVVA
jgi:light-regulated signal transduction histidine kinase (bacteriophytochrome)